MDNADDPSLELSPFLPRCSHGHIIITTRDRHRETLAPASTHAVDGLPLEESTTLLLNTSQYEDNVVNRHLSEEVAKELGCLPLALAHAGSYIRLRQCLDTYLGTYRESNSRLLKRKFDMPQGYQHSVARTIEMSFEKLSHQAQDLLGLLSHLDARSISRSIIEKAASRGFLHMVVEDQSVQSSNNKTGEYANTLIRVICPGGDWSSLEFDDLIEECEQYSLVQLSTQSGYKFYSMHVLVQGFIQENHKEVQGHPSRRLVARLLGSAITDGNRYEHMAFNRLLSPHLLLVNLDDITEAVDHYRYGVVLEEVGEGRLATSHMECCVKMRTRFLGEESELTLDAMEMLAILYSMAGKEEEALEMRQKMVSTRKSLVGEDHLDTLRSIRNLAISCSNLGRHEEALALEEEVVGKQRRILGEHHADTLSSIHNLALSYSNLGKHEEALALREEVVEKYRKLFSEDYVDTLMLIHGLAASYSNLGRHEEALELEKEVIEKQKRLLGEDHLYTLRSVYNLVISYSNLGRHDEALSLGEDLVAKCTKFLGDHHRDTLDAMNALSRTHAKLGREDDASKLRAIVSSRRTDLLQ
jgi:tetratricopeptide (TPR) repeat protein